MQEVDDLVAYWGADEGKRPDGGRGRLEQRAYVRCGGKGRVGVPGIGRSSR